ncbi:MAG: acetamidase [Planctomycetaceae bacterium]|nr:acetamidase [Planctomycetaceae bacterium]
MEHHFSPIDYHISLGPHEPVLRVADGDTIITTTVDARGFDSNREQTAPRGNPQTGPFYVEGAEPGSTLVVELDEIKPNRRYGFCGTAVAPNVVDPTYISELPEAGLAEWDVDVDAWTARLVAPESKLGELTIPLEPMIGCFGVAAFRGQAISTATSAEHGGNMDYRGFVEGTKVYFPVFEPGALFFLGDGHAAQGDGEIVGSGIEISMDVRVTLRVIKAKKIGWPRAENDDWIMTVGNARPLDQATQHATTEMLRWLQQDYGLDALGANLLMAQCVRYELGNIYDPAYTMVCKINKQWLK